VVSLVASGGAQAIQSHAVALAFESTACRMACTVTAWTMHSKHLLAVPMKNGPGLPGSDWP
jgi:hypothetical protein